MAADFVINTDHKMVFSFGWGRLTISDVNQHRTRLLLDTRYCRDFAQIISLADVTEMALSNSEINSLAKQGLFAPESRRAMVAPSDLQFGLSRVFDSYTAGQSIRIFRELKDAVAWVGVPLEIAERVFEGFRSAHGLAESGRREDWPPGSHTT
jgi:hypothetical protein